jgi:general secretion pathway protein H
MQRAQSIRGPGRGFTLIEVTITLLIISLAAAVVVVNFGAASESLRSSAARLAGTIRASYDTASLTGQIHRLAFDFDGSVVKVEATDRLLSMTGDANPLVRGARNADAPSGLESMFSMMMQSSLAEKGEANEDEDAEPEPPSALQALVGLAEPPGSVGDATFGPAEDDLALEEGVHLLDVWVQGMDEPVTEGMAYMYFFPQGYTQEAYIHLEDEDGAVFTVRVRGLTGSTELYPEYVEVGK